MRVISGYVMLSSQMFKDAQRAEDSFRELKWIARHYDEATPEQRARWDAFKKALDEREDGGQA